MIYVREKSQLFRSGKVSALSVTTGADGKSSRFVVLAFVSSSPSVLALLAKALA
jgi:hypothetical protein